MPSKIRKYKKYDYNKSLDQLREMSQLPDVELSSQPTFPVQVKKMEDSQQKFINMSVSNQVYKRSSSHQEYSIQDQDQQNSRHNKKNQIKQVKQQEPFLSYSPLQPQKRQKLDHKRQKLNKHDQIDQNSPSKYQQQNQFTQGAQFQALHYYNFDPAQNQRYSLQFQKQTKPQWDPQDVLRTSFTFNNPYMRIQVQLQQQRKIMRDKIKSYLIKKYPNTIGKMQSNTSIGSSRDSIKQQNKNEKPMRKRKKKRVQVTAKILKQVQALFRQYQVQQDSAGTPFYRKRITHKMIGQTLNISMTEIKHLYEQFRMDPLFTIRLGKMAPTDNKGNAMAQQLSQVRLKYLQEIISRNCVKTQQQMADQMNHNPQLLQRDRNGHLLPITRRHIQDLLKKGNYSRKKVQMVPKNRNSPQTVQMRYHYCKRYLQMLAIPNVRFNMLTVRDRGWAKKGCPATKSTVNSKGKDIILLAMMSISGINFYELSDGYNAAAFTIAMDKIGRMLIQTGINPQRYIIMDNCPIHNRQNLRHIQQAYSIKMIYLPPYTPMLNPIQYWFHQIKGIIRTKTYKTRNQMKASLQSAIGSFQRKNLQNYYNCIKPALQQGIKRQLFK